VERGRENDFIAKVNEHHAKGGDVVVVGENCFYCGNPVDPKIKNNPAFLLGNDKDWESKPKLVIGMCERCGLMAKGVQGFR